MPLVNGGDTHRDKERSMCMDDGWALVVRSVGRRELESSPGAQAAMKKEWDAFRSLGTWDEKGVRPWAQVSEEARKQGVKAHVGRIFGICVEKGSELPEGSPGRKFKGRVVFQGNQVRDEENLGALFNDLGSSPATMAAGRFVDFYGLLKGHKIEQADAVRAYTQAPLMGVTT